MRVALRGVVLCARTNVRATVDIVHGRSHSVINHRAFHLALIAFVCGLMVLLSGSSPAQLAGTDGFTPQINNRVEQAEAQHHTAAPKVSLESRSVDDLLEEAVGLAESTDDDDETEHYFLRVDLSALRSQARLYESASDRALTPFRLRAFSTRGSPLA